MNLRHTFLGLALAAVSALAADTGLLSLVMKDPAMVAGVDIDRARNSPLGQKMIAEMKDDDKHFQQLLESTGFDPRKDLHEALVVSTGGNKPESGLVLVRGNFDASKIAAFAKSQGAVSTLYKGVEVWQGPESKSEGAFAFVDSSIAILGNLAQVTAAIDRKQAGQGGLSQDLAAKVVLWSGQNDAWIVSNQPISGFGPFPNKGTNPGGLSVDSIKAASAGIRFGSVVDISAETTMRSPQDATAFADVIRFLVSMMRSNQDPNRQVPEPISNMIDSLQLDPVGDVLKIHMSMPETDLEKLMNTGKGRTAKRASAR